MCTLNNFFTPCISFFFFFMAYFYWGGQLYSTLLSSTSPQSKQAINAALGELISINPFFVLFCLMGISSSKRTINCSNTFSRREATLFKNSGFLSRRGIQSHWYKLLFLNENEDHHSLWFEKMLINIYSLWLHCHRILEMLKLCC